MKILYQILIVLLSAGAFSHARPTADENLASRALAARNNWEAVFGFYSSSTQCQVATQVFTVGTLNECHNLASPAQSWSALEVGSEIVNDYIWVFAGPNCNSGGLSFYRLGYLNAPDDCIFRSGGTLIESFLITNGPFV
ncbi:hypothetical protein AYL99_04592 [Fonsecaea erecta]|uniref:Uncharacterized protein n=1 Tax=Fonsecaea erecta TaxID=1367422 RepID=A0A178ZRD1_9EURO|nr:hypothetical protein AYL99_04592 [Fonsecaea erecta]OAP62389.1 hypothetical protein AYL99_04592 [Fonsecaea erecta]